MEPPAHLQVVHSILQAVLSSDNFTRKLQEQELSRLKEQHPDELVVSLLYFLRQAKESHFRTLAAVLLRQMLTALNLTAPAIWGALSEDVQRTVKNELIAALVTEPEKAVRKRIADTVGELAATVLSSNAAEWPELLPFVFTNIADDIQLTSSLHILASLSTYIHKQLMTHKSDMWKVFSLGLQAQSLNTVLVTATTICAFLSIVKTSDAMEFSNILTPLITSALRIIKENPIDAKEVMEALVDLAEAEPNFYAKQFETMMNFMVEVFALPVEIGVKSLMVELIVSLVERKPKLIRGNESRSKLVLEKIFFLMVSVDPEVEETWSRPPEGFQDKNDEQEIEIDYAQTGRKCISRLIESVGDEHLSPFLTSAAQVLLSNEQDWRMKYSALMTISELGQYVEDEGKIRDLARVVLEHVNINLHPKIRYAAFHAIGQLCEDLGDELRNPYHRDLAQALLTGLDDPVPRVRAHCAAAVTNFFEEGLSEVVQPYVQAFTTKLVPLIQRTQPSLVIEYAITALASVADATKENFRQQYQELLPVLVDIVNSYTESAYKQLRGRAIECITLMCVAVGKQVYLGHLGQIVSLLKKIQEQELTKADPQTSYIMNAWQRLCADLKSDFAICLPEVIPGLLSMAQINVTASTALAPDSSFNLEEIAQVSSKSKALNLNTSELEDKKVAIETLLTIMNMMKGSYLPYVQETVGLCMPLVAYAINEDIRIAAAGCLAAALRTVRDSALSDAGQQTVALAKLLFPVVWEALQREFDSDVSIAQLQTLKAIIETPNCAFFSQTEIQLIGEGTIKLLDKALNEKSPADTQDSDSEGEDELENLRKAEEGKLHNSLAEVFSAVFKTHTTEALPIVSYFYSTKLPALLDPSGKDDHIKFAIYIIDDIIEYIGPARIGSAWLGLKDPLLTYSVSANPEIRQAACYGLGIFAINTLPDLFSASGPQIVSALMQAVDHNVGKGNPAYHHARDNAVSAVGKVLKHQTGSVNLAEIVPFWVNHLPLKHDKAEAKIMHGMLADFVVQNERALVESEGQVFAGILAKIVHVLSNLLETKLIPTDFTKKTQGFLQALKTHGGSGLSEIWAGLSELQKSRINRLVGS